MNAPPRTSTTLLAVGLFLAGALASSCDDWDDDDDCHTHVSGSTTITHCHDDDFDDDDFDDDDVFVVIAQSAEVAALVTASEADGVAAFHVDIGEIVLEGRKSEPRSIRSARDSSRVDLVNLRGRGPTQLFELLAGRTEVPATTYESVRIALGEPTLVLASGRRIAGDDLALAGGGQLEVVLPEPLLLGPGDVAFLLIELDLERSLLPPSRLASVAGGTAPEPSWRFRPLVHVECVREDLLGVVDAPAEIAGSIAYVDPDTRSIWVEVAPGHGLLEAVVPEESGVVDALLQPAALADLTLGDGIGIRGEWGLGGLVVAESVIAGGWSWIHGAVEAIERRDDETLIAIRDPSSGILRTVAALEPTLVLGDRREPGDLADLTVGRHVRIAACERPGGKVPVAARIVVSPESTSSAFPAAGGLRGVVSAVDVPGRTIVVSDGRAERSLAVPLDARLILASEGVDLVRERRLRLAEVEVGMLLEAASRPTADGRSAERSEIFVFSHDRP